MSTTSIEWTDRVWNPVRGCSLVSPGCENCYAMKQAHRFSGKGQPYEGLTVLGKHGPRWTGRARFVPEMLEAPLHWRKPSRIFVNSMSDLFHEDVTDEQIAAVFGVMAACQQHTFQVLTKRPERMLKWFGWTAKCGQQLVDEVGEKPPSGSPNSAACAHFTGSTLLEDALNYVVACNAAWPLPNVWLGVSCEDQQRADERIPLLLQTPAAVRFVSAEPLLGPISLSVYLVDDLARAGRAPRMEIDWVIAGGESGPGARPCNIEWIRSIVQQCKDAGASAFVKQLGGNTRADEGDGPAVRWYLSDRKGGDMAEWPEDLCVQEFPEVKNG
jgi:protein gp37